ncbi:hypothetical protein [Enterocloster bolteae]|uniref:hypothetical protein n=1 Tax=Enterocloster bolteae TaxID=208479 RepID=UPI0018A1103D|nr:hypothetical protein [Enterocloster bolteae]
MIRNREEVESVLNEGEKILLKRPELAEMSIHDMLNELDDGTEQMIHYRWGVAAWLVIKSLKSFESKMLVEPLSEVDSGVLTYEYAGYLLQSRYKVSMVELILEAEKCGKFDKIISYVKDNIIYEEKLYEQYIISVLNTMENHKSHNCYRAFLMQYAKHIVDKDAQKLVEGLLDDIDRQIYYDFMQVMRWEWYQKDAAEANEVIGRMLGRRSVWSKKVAIDYLEASLIYDKAVFHQYFFQVENLIQESEELWQMLIPVFIKYVLKVCDDGTEKLEPVYKQVLEHLEKISDSSLNIKSSFVQAIQWTEDIPDKLDNIFKTIISHSFNRDRRILDMLDSRLYNRLTKGHWKETLHVMLKVFTANKYYSHYREFFDVMNSVHSGLSEYTEEVTVEALGCMLSGDRELFFFGIGLLDEVGDLKILHKSVDESNFDFAVAYDDKQMIHLMKGVLYYIADNKRICHMAFQLLELSNESNEKYMEFCIADVYGNYPATMHEVAEYYKTVASQKQVSLAEKVLEMHERMLNERKLSYEIRDLEISREHQYIYRRAMQEQNRMINKNANKKSVFGQLFKRRTLKYGTRNAHVCSGKKEEKFYQVNPYMHHEYHMELPAIYVKDPVEYEFRRGTFLEEIMHNEISDKGLSDSTERKR